MNDLFDPVPLPCGSVLPNRIAKASMEENLGGHGQLPGEAVFRLYGRWAEGGAGLLLTGNVMVDPRALTTPAGIAVDPRTPSEPFRRWAEAARAGGGQVWMQLNHPGRQVMADMGNEALAPSAVPLQLGKHGKRFASPRALTGDEIAAVVNAFADAAAFAQRAGFDGVQIHAAHGYLLSQFLSPLTNRRTDGWGGSIDNRARLLLDVVAAVRGRVDAGFAVGVKLNSADFQRGGFDADDAQAVVRMLNERAVDLVELSGGSFESPAMRGQTADERTLAREAYFLEFAEDVKRVAAMPVMMTGGVRRRAVAQEVVGRGVDVVGIATALVMDPALPRHWRDGELAVEAPHVGWRDKAMAAAAGSAVMRRLIERGSRGVAPARLSPLWSLILDQRARKGALKRYRRWLETR